MTAYVETSAAAKLLIEETESAALSAYLDLLAERHVTVASSMVLETELRRLATRHEIDQSTVTELLDRFDLVTPDRAIFVEAGLLPGRYLRSLDALHVAIALRINAEEFLAYDTRQSEAARAVGLHVAAPT
ncbi:type II toxin-antitoxin system VapC family toxin [Haloechinothrix sp. LS1_15]|uniref:type II toxin-antitoxin system VapC family toxin n=1 Tax=Haloechinothrix sp. LS1_15 TaxID=2652248 RepID=UPI0029453FC1|nr:type II toxin-antitoxin system VapC family toxin [Haloechinothrix sp. LS1_15]MDV6013607.1 type II toxin-antitoxin system VapC family toxin [Haloechinothrix sp. LS1_15]